MADQLAMAEQTLLAELKSIFRTTTAEIKCPRCKQWATGSSRAKYKWWGSCGDPHYDESSEPIMISLAKHASMCIHRRPAATPAPTTASAPPANLNPSPAAPDSTPPPGLAAPAGRRKRWELVNYVDEDVDELVDIIDKINDLDELLKISELCITRMQQLRFTAA